jgi:CBS domain-containing membrane protein
VRRIFHHIAGPLLTAFGSGIAIATISIICLKLAEKLGVNIWVIAPIGASAALVFAAPYSPFSQPKNVILGNCLSAICGIAAMHLNLDIHISAGIAVGMAIGTMIIFRVLHPPGGGVALLMVLTKVTAPMIVIFPTMINSIILVLCAILFHKFTHHHYPHIHQLQKSETAN